MVNLLKKCNLPYNSVLKLPRGLSFISFKGFLFVCCFAFFLHRPSRVYQKLHYDYSKSDANLRIFYARIGSSGVALWIHTFT